MTEAKERCEYELWVEEYFKLPATSPIDGVLIVDYGSLVDLLATFDRSQKKKDAESQILSSSEFDKRIEPIVRAIPAGDAYLFVHFSQADDHYSGHFHGMDKFDAIIVIQHLARLSGLSQLDMQTIAIME